MSDRLYYVVMGFLVFIMVAWIIADVHFRNKDADACEAKHGVIVEGSSGNLCIPQTFIINIKEAK